MKKPLVSNIKRSCGRLPTGYASWKRSCAGNPAKVKLFEYSSCMMGVADAQTARFEYANPALLTSLGYTETYFRDTPFLDLVHPDDQTTTVLAMTRLNGGGEVHAFINRYRCADGRYLYFEWKAYPLNGKYYAFANDVTYRYQNPVPTNESENPEKKKRFGYSIWEIMNPISFW